MTLDSEQVKTLKNESRKTSVNDIWQEFVNSQKYTCMSKLRTEVCPEIFKFYEPSMHTMVTCPTLKKNSKRKYYSCNFGCI